MSRLDRVVSDLLTANPEALKAAVEQLTPEEREKLRAVVLRHKPAAVFHQPAVTPEPPFREPLSRHRFTWRTCASAAVPATAHEGPLGALAEAARREGAQRDGRIFRGTRTRLQLGLQEVADGWSASAVEVGELERGARQFPETDDLNAALQQLWLWHVERRGQRAASSTGGVL